MIDFDVLINRNEVFSRFNVKAEDFLDNKDPILRQKTGIIYLIVNMVNGKVYVGLTTSTFYDRYKCNWVRQTDNDHLKKAAQKYGKDNFRIIILEKGMGINILNILETYYILTFKSNNPEYGYNKTTGGENNYIYSLDAIAKMIANHPSRLTLEKFIDKAKQIHGNRYDYSNINYINSSIKIDIFCPQCGIFFKQTPNKHLGGQGCKSCARRASLITFDEFIDRVKPELRNEYEFFKDTYTRFHDGVVTLKHLKCGTIFNKNPNELTRMFLPCPTCYKQYCIDKGKRLRSYVNNKNVSKWKLAKGFESYKQKIKDVYNERISCLEYSSKPFFNERNILYVKHLCNDCHHEFWRIRTEYDKPCPNCKHLTIKESHA